MNRCDNLRAKLSAAGFDAALVHRPVNIRYLTGYTGEGCALITKDESIIVTDFRYTEQAGRQAPASRCIETNAGLREADVLKKLTGENGIRRLAVERDFLTWNEHEALKAALSDVEFGAMGKMIEDLRIVKDETEIAAICKACEISSRAFDNLLGRMHTGMTEKQVQLMLEYEMLTLGADSLAFNTIAATGVNGSLPHAIPSDNVIKEGDLLTLDFGANVDGYCADMTRTVGFGKIGGALREVYDTVYEAHMACLKAVKVGVACREIDALAHSIIDPKYPGKFGHGLGHGVGLLIHEQPRLNSTSTEILEVGHVVTIEPGVYIPGLGGCRIEDTVILTSDGYIDPVTSPKHLIEL